MTERGGVPAWGRGEGGVEGWTEGPAGAALMSGGNVPGGSAVGCVAE